MTPSKRNLRNVLGWLAAVLLAANLSAQIVPAGASNLVLAKVADFRLKDERFGAAAVAEGNYVYIIGGRNSGGILGDIERFDVRTHEIVKLTKDLTPRHHHGAVLLGGKIYVFGGEGYRLPDGNHFEPNLDIYDLASGKITRGAPMTIPTGYFAAGSIGGKIYAIGGARMAGFRVTMTSLTEVYDPATNVWSEAAPMPTARECRSAVSVAGCILVLGGYRPPDISVGLKTVECFVPEKNQWYSLPDLAQGVGAASAAALGHDVYLFGNFDPADKVLDYDLVTHASTVFKRGFSPASQTAAVTLNGSIYVVGGINGGARQSHIGDPMGDIQIFALSRAE
jgi:N-acetylneuraminic acid mutarotase